MLGDPTHCTFRSWILLFLLLMFLGPDVSNFSQTWPSGCLIQHERFYNFSQISNKSVQFQRQCWSTVLFATEKVLKDLGGTTSMNGSTRAQSGCRPDNGESIPLFGCRPKLRMLHYVLEQQWMSMSAAECSGILTCKLPTRRRQ